jgi:phenylalanyl-tRNA synthetase beta chain
MPTITINKQDLLKQIGKKLPDEKLKNRISMLGTDLEEVTSKEITVEIFPNRPDMLSSEGFARALSTFIGSKKGLTNYKTKSSKYEVKIDNKVNAVRPHAAVAVVKGIKFNDAAIESLMQVQEKLHSTHGRNRKKVSIGVYDLDSIKFPLTYTTKKKDFKFVPLEMKKELTLSQILTQHPKGKDYAKLLDNFEEYPIWLDANNQVLSMPPIINSEETKVTKKSKDLFIDVTGLDKIAVEKALNIIVASLADRGGKIYEVKVGNKTYPNLAPEKVKLDINYANKILGLNLTQKEVEKLLAQMGIDYKNGIAKVPSYRTDIMDQIDLVEDIAIAYGYKNFESEIPNVATIAQEDPLEKFKTKVANILVGFGLIETSTYNLTSKKNQLKKMCTKIKVVEIENALNEEYNVLRAWMIPSLLEVLKNNRHNEYPQSIFEVGNIFSPKEQSRLCVMSAHKTANYTELKQILDYLLTNLGLDYEIEEVEHDSFIQGRVGRVLVKGKKVAYMGEINPEVLTNFELEVPVSTFELNLTELFKSI